MERLWSEQLTVNAPNNRVVVGRRAVLDTFVHSGIINFKTFDRQIEFIRADGSFVFIMGLETVTPLSDARAQASWPGARSRGASRTSGKMKKGRGGCSRGTRM